MEDDDDFGKWFFGEDSNLTASCLSRAADFFREDLGMRFRMELQILALHDDEKRGDALRLLAAHREFHPKLAPILWDSVGIVFVLIQEVSSAYQMVRTLCLTEVAAERVSDALVLLKCLASHSDAKRLLVNALRILCISPFTVAKLQEYLYPILRTAHKDKLHENLRLRSLEVIDKILEVDDEEIIKALAQARMVLYCLRCIVASEIPVKEVAALILQRILMHEGGMQCCFEAICRFPMISHALTFAVEERGVVLSTLLLRRIAACFLSLSKHSSALEVLHNSLPMRLGDPYIANILEVEPIARDILREAAANLTGGGGSGHRPVKPRLGPIGGPPASRMN